MEVQFVESKNLKEKPTGALGLVNITQTICL